MVARGRSCTVAALEGVATELAAIEAAVQAAPCILSWGACCVRGTQNDLARASAKRCAFRNSFALCPSLLP